MKVAPITRDPAGKAGDWTLGLGRLFMKRMSSFLKGQRREWGPKGAAKGERSGATRIAVREGEPGGGGARL